ncbi:MAG: hypothetical protein EOO56_26740 [Hymenobacter sp.]|nr:MAG: hypothetical protein EOO56_26740 [Hymenobacter sp.]
MKSFAKVSLLFALILTGRYLQLTAPATALARPVASSGPALPQVLTRYVAVVSTKPAMLPQAAQPVRGYFL